MACTITLDAPNKPNRSGASGNAKITNSGGAAVTLSGVQASLAGNRGHAPVRVALPLPAPTANNHAFGSGAGGGTVGGLTIAAGASITVSFDFMAIAGTLSVQAFVSDGSNPVATATISPT